MSEYMNENIRCYPSEFSGHVEVRTVLVAGDIGDYAAYSGVGSREFVMRSGNKIPFEEAIVHFPMGLKSENYRR